MNSLVIDEILRIVLGGLGPGFLLGLFAFKVKSRWCPRCGATTETLHRTDHQ